MTVVDWAKEVEEEQDLSDVEPTTPVVIDPNSCLPDIPEFFDPDEYIEPEDVVIKLPNGDFTKVSWAVVPDPKAADVDEPPFIIVQTSSTFRPHVARVKKSILRRRSWQKYGQSADDGEGPNSGTTGLGENVDIQYLKKSQLNVQIGDRPAEDWLDEADMEYLKKLGPQTKSVMSATKIWPSEQRTLFARQYAENKGVTKQDVAGPGASTSRWGPAAKGVEAVPDNRPPRIRAGNDRDDEGCTVRVTNLSESITDADMHELFGQCGHIRRVFVARRKHTGGAKGFAFVTFASPSMANKAVRLLDRFKYDFRVINVEISTDRKN